MIAYEPVVEDGQRTGRKGLLSIGVLAIFRRHISDLGMIPFPNP